jgi:hypothetical protein
MILSFDVSNMEPKGELAWHLPGEQRRLLFADQPKVKRRERSVPLEDAERQFSVSQYVQPADFHETAHWRNTPPRLLQILSRRMKE